MPSASYISSTSYAGQTPIATAIPPPREGGSGGGRADKERGPGQDTHWSTPLPPPLHAGEAAASSSWINLVERWFAELTNRKLRRSAHRSVIELEADIRKWINEWNKRPKPFVWTKTADEILDHLAAYCRRINNSEHYDRAVGDSATSARCLNTPPDLPNRAYKLLIWTL